MGYALCFSCEEKFEAGYADPFIPPNALVPFCHNCNGDTPEEFLWDVSELETEPNLTFYPDLGDEGWAIKNRYGDLDSYLTYMNETSSMDFDRDSLSLPEEDCWEIFVQTSDDEELIQEAREALQDRVLE